MNLLRLRLESSVGWALSFLVVVVVAVVVV
jgi:hypothetical protein